MSNAEPDLSQFRSMVREWVEANLPQAIRYKGYPPDRSACHLAEDYANWKAAVVEKGWGVPDWPCNYGGGGLSPIEAKIIFEEMQNAGGFNPLISMGTMMLGPTLLEYGTEEQKQEHLPPIARGEILWCQGFSEPGAGSDLASLQTRAEDRGDHFIINGQKVWTSGADTADWCFCLVRTDTTRKHAGISFVLLEMNQPGVEARPILLIDGTSPFCETFLTDAVALKKNLVGPLNGGWSIAKRLLQHERSSLGTPSSDIYAPPAPIDELARSYIGTDSRGELLDRDIRSRIASNLIDGYALQLTGQRVIREAKANGGISFTASILKNAGTWHQQSTNELALEIMGHQGLGWGDEYFSVEELKVARTWLHGKCTTIYGGSQEVQNNIIARRILDLPVTAVS
jgi:alkylation response protein AidB-like acyl-CoA dehydrogenase